VDNAGSVFLKGQEVFSGTIALILLKTILGIGIGKSFHQPVPGYLCQYGCSCYGYAALITSSNWNKSGFANRGKPAAIDIYKIRNGYVRL
jgi:hypothetical protein